MCYVVSVMQYVVCVMQYACVVQYVVSLALLYTLFAII